MLPPWSGEWLVVDTLSFASAKTHAYVTTKNDYRRNLLLTNPTPAAAPDAARRRSAGPVCGCEGGGIDAMTFPFQGECAPSKFAPPIPPAVWGYGTVGMLPGKPFVVPAPA
jgi:hypothetical protein